MWLVVLLTGVSIHAQDNSQDQSGESTTNGSTSIVQEVNSSVELVENKRETIAQLRTRKQELETENSNITLELVEIQARIAEIEAQAIKDEVDPSTIEIEVNDETKTIEILERDLVVKQTEFDSNKEQITQIDEEIAELQSGLDQEVNDFRGEIVVNSATTVSYFILIVIFWIIYEVAQVIITRFAPERLHGLIRFSLLAIALVATIITLFVAFAARIEFIFASFGVISAALVVALQDLVSSFFGWILILTQSQYKKGHIVRMGQGDSSVTGVVTSIGLLRTYLDEKIGNQHALDFEQNTGKVISFPNNKIFTEPIVNFSNNDPYLWYSLSLTITFESDAQLGYKVLNEYMQQWYEKHSDIRGKAKRENHKPRIYTHIAGDGPCFTIWYSSKIGAYRTTLDVLSRELLEVLDKHSLDLAYVTVRTVGNLDINQQKKK
jgi:hypothetical protein